ncbi:COX15/CtaA family protein [Pelagibacterales bacterium SAG-MED41]|nr:COX15/CtaA family protein [Pelagibacterales bacterium SAG-MED41]|tara:strand:+ start:470 stop:1495 length:1026 start_codon:yes stop_codon:yes gene_type:complete
MYSDERKIYKLFTNWLVVSLVLVFLIIIVGGLTRLTNSGLSITEWELFKGILPPLNDSSWQEYFNLYKEIPQYKLLNYDMVLDEFKIIFYWEYIHRILARLIGLFFLIPLIFFYISKKIQKEHMRICYFIFTLIIIQGFLGWYMVKSGLVNDVTVSHYRLSMHLTTAIIIISSIYWLIMNTTFKKNKLFFNFEKNNFPFLILIFLILTQIILGAFVSGLDAGQIYQTWPKMGNNYFPNDLILKNFNDTIEFNNHSLVQFYHRSLAYLIILYVLILSIFIYKKKLINLYKSIRILIFFLLIQISLGVFTLVSGLNIHLASSHQITSILLVLSALNLYYLRAK